MRGGKWEKYTLSDLQSFTLLRFWPESNYDGDYLVVDPDVFPVKFDVNSVSKIREMFGDGLYAVPGVRPGEWRSSVMIRVGYSKRPLWIFQSLVEEIFDGSMDYNDAILLKSISNHIKPVSEYYNHYDKLTPETLMLHTTSRNTQPWKTGLRIDYVNHKLNFFQRLRSKYFLRPRYQKHPSAQVERFFLESLSEALKAGYVSERTLNGAVLSGDVRSDIRSILRELQ